MAIEDWQKLFDDKSAGYIYRELKYEYFTPDPKPTKKRKTHVVAFDIETHGDKNEFLLGVLYFEGGKEVFHSRKKMFAQMKKMANKHTFFIATNLGFDLMALCSGTILMKKVNMMTLDNRLISAKIVVRDKTLNFRDSINYFPVGVEVLGKIVGAKKMQQPKAFARKPNNTEEENELVRYCIRDAEITYKFMRLLYDWFEQFNIKIRATIAACSLEIFRINYLDRGLRRISFKQYQAELEAYYGGRTEVFIRGHLTKEKIKKLFNTDTIKCYDFNSMYPAIMKDEKFPIPDNPIYCKHPRQSVYKEYDFGICKAKVTVPENTEKCFLCRRDLKGGKLIFGVGTWTGTYTYLHLRYAEQHGAIIHKIWDTYTYEEEWRPFQNFITYFYNKRLEYKAQNSYMELFCKLVMNSLYGKFAMKMRNKEVRHIDEMYKSSPDGTVCKKACYHIDCFDAKGYEEHTTGQFEQWRYYTKVAQKDKDISKAIHPVIAAHVTAYAHIKLHQYMNCNTLYMDTDSLFTPDTLPTGNQLGELKLEYETDDCVFIAPKTYSIKDKYVKGKGMKGWNKKERLEESQKEFIDLATRKIEYVQSLRFMKFFSAQRKFRGNWYVPNEKLIFEKTMSLEDTKRKWPGEFNFDEVQFSKPLLIEEE